MDSPTFNVLSVCSGAGGLDLGLHLAIRNARNVGYVEIEAHACEVLATRMEEGVLDDAPVWTNLRTFDGRPWRGVVDSIVGGYPCQPFSIAGRRKGKDDPRHLWPEIARIIREIGPGEVFFENVGNHLNCGFREVAGELQAMGYRVAAGLFTAEEVGDTQKRERLFILARRDGDWDNNGAVHEMASTELPQRGSLSECRDGSREGADRDREEDGGGWSRQ